MFNHNNKNTEKIIEGLQQPTWQEINKQLSECKACGLHHGEIPKTGGECIHGWSNDKECIYWCHEKVTGGTILVKKNCDHGDEMLCINCAPVVLTSSSEGDIWEEKCRCGRPDLHHKFENGECPITVPFTNSKHGYRSLTGEWEYQRLTYAYKSGQIDGEANTLRRILEWAEKEGRNGEYYAAEDFKLIPVFALKDYLTHNQDER